MEISTLGGFPRQAGNLLSRVKPNGLLWDASYPMKATPLSTFLLLLACCFASAAPYRTGEQVQPFQAKDQHGNSYQFSQAETEFILVSHDMETGKKTNAVLTSLGRDYLPARKAVFVSNIHGMPAVGRAFALPKMRKYTHRIVLADDEALMARFPQEPGKVSVLKISRGKIVSLRFWNPEVEPISDFLQ